MDYRKLRGRICEIFGTMQKFAKAMGKDSSTISFKLNNKSPWTDADIVKACEVLEIAIEDVPLYFFVKKS